MVPDFPMFFMSLLGYRTCYNKTSPAEDSQAHKLPF